MQKLFSTDQVRVGERFRSWQELARSMILPSFEHQQIGPGPFRAHIETAAVGQLSLTRTSFSALRLEMPPHAVHRHPKPDQLSILMRLSGAAILNQHGRVTPHRARELVVIDHSAPVSSEYHDTTQAMVIEVPRERLERLLGPARVYANLASGDLPGASLSRAFFTELARTQGELSADTAERMASVGIDLIVASLAERMAQDTPKPLQATVTVQRAKAHIEASLGDPTLDPSQVAAAVGVSLRRLHELFHRHGRSVSDWIWHRRLEAAVRQLAAPGMMHLPIGTVAYGCGFVSQAHFSKRFRSRYGLSPSDYRRQAHEAARR